MKILSRWIVLSLLAVAGAASAVNMPLRIPFQGKLIDPADNSPRNGDVVMTFRIYDVPTAGSALYTEPMTVAVNNGVFAVQLGTSAQLSANLFSHASAYLGITVAGDSEMLPRQPLTMSAYAFTSMQLASPSDIRVNAGTSYSTFTAQGNLTMQYGVVAGTGTYAILTSTGVGTFGIVTSSGINMGGGTLKLEADSKGIDATGTGITASTVSFVGGTADPAGVDGLVYFNSSSSTLKSYSTAFGWQWLYPQSGLAQARTVDANTAGAAKAAAGTILIAPITLSGPMVVNTMRARVSTILGAAGDIGVYNSTGGLVLQGGSSSLTTAAAVKTVAPVQTGAGRWLPPGQYYAALTWNSTTGIVTGLTLTAAMVPRCGSVLGGGLVLPATINPAAITNLVNCPFVSLNN
ncbi:MAG: hypothetical protein Q8T11_11365 [Elusimicrobiota bacterium]|nr:hypothetical protein [Elusimicrobiota bacterium]